MQTAEMSSTRGWGCGWEAELALLPKKGISPMCTRIVKARSAYRAPLFYSKAADVGRVIEQGKSLPAPFWKTFWSR